MDIFSDQVNLNSQDLFRSYQISIQPQTKADQMIFAHQKGTSLEPTLRYREIIPDQETSLELLTLIM